MNAQPDADSESPLREGVRTLMYGPEDLGVAVIIPGANSILFRGGENDTLQLAEYTRRDITIARALLQDAMNRLDSVNQPYPIPVPQPYPGRPAW
jgi:hypothetical protein